MVNSLKIIYALTICFYGLRGEIVTNSSSGLTDDADYEYSVEYGDEVATSGGYEVVPITTAKPSTGVLDGNEIEVIEDTLNGPATPVVLIKPVVSTPTPKPGVPVLTYADELSSTREPFAEDPQQEDAEAYEIVTDVPHVITEKPNVHVDNIDNIDNSDISDIQKKIEALARKLQLDNTEVTPEEINSLSQVAGAIAILGEEIDEISKGEAVNKNIYDLQTQYLHLYQQMETFNDTLNAMFEAETEKRVEIVLWLLERGKTTEAAEEVSRIHVNSKLQKITSEFYGGKRENIVVTVNFIYHLSDPMQQLITFHSLFSEMKMYNQSDDPGVLPIMDKIIEIHGLKEFPSIKQDAGVLLYDVFRDSVEAEAKKLLENWQSKMSKSEYQDIAEFASKSPVYSNSLNENMILLLWLPNSFETNYEFLKALPDLNNRLAGYMCLNEVYKNYHRYDEMIKLAVIVRREFEENGDFINEFVFGEFKSRFWRPVKKLIWSDSCLVKNVFTGKYLFEYKDVDDRDVATYNIETVRWEGRFGDGTNNDLRWGFVPSNSLGKFEIRNIEHHHSLAVEDEVVDNFKSWPRRKVVTSSKDNRTVLWTVLLSDRNEVFSFKSDLGFLTVDRNSSYVYADDKPKFANVSRQNEKEFLQHHLWDIECY